MPAKIYGWKSGDATPVQYTGDATGRDAAYAAMSNNGHVLFGPGTEALGEGTIPAGVKVTRWTAAGKSSIVGDTYHRGRPWHDVRAWGAKGDNSPDDRSAILAAITAAEADGSYLVYLPAGDYKTAGGLVCKRETVLQGAGNGGTKLILTSTTATLVKWASATTSGAQGGGARDIQFVGAGGSSTSVGVSFGDGANPSYYANRLTLAHCSVSGFGTGILIDGPGTITTGQNSATDGFVIDRCLILQNIHQGMFVKCTFSVEICTVRETYFTGNGTAATDGCAIGLSSSGGGGGTSASGMLNLNCVSSTFNNNGDGTLGQIHCPASAVLELAMTGCSFESITTPRHHIVALSDGSSTYNGPRATIKLINCYLQNFTVTALRELVVIAAGQLYAYGTRFEHEAAADFTVAGCTTNGTTTVTTSNNFLTAGVRPGAKITGTNISAGTYVKSVESATSLTLSQVASGSGSGITMTFDRRDCIIKAGLAGQFTSVALFGNQFFFHGSNLTNACILNLVLGQQGQTSVFALGNNLWNLATAAELVVNPVAAVVEGDLNKVPNADYNTNNGLTATFLAILASNDPTVRIPFNMTIATGKLTSGGISLEGFDVGAGFANFKTPISTSVPAAAASRDGILVIEDAGAGNCNLVFYCRGERYRIDGGANV